MNSAGFPDRFRDALGNSSKRIRAALPLLAKEKATLVCGEFGRDVMRAAKDSGCDAVAAWELLCRWSTASWWWLRQWTPQSRPWKETAGAFQFYLFAAGFDWPAVARLMKHGAHPTDASAELLRLHDGKTSLDFEAEVLRACSWIEAGDAAGHLEFYRLAPLTADPNDVSSIIAKNVVAHRAGIRDQVPAALSRELFISASGKLTAGGCALPELDPADPAAKTAALGWVRQSDLWLVRLWPAFRGAGWTAKELAKWSFDTFGDRAAVPEDYKQFGTRLRRLGLRDAAAPGRQSAPKEISFLGRLGIGGAEHPCFPPLARWLAANPTQEP